MRHGDIKEATTTFPDCATERRSLPQHITIYRYTYFAGNVTSGRPPESLQVH